MLDKDQYNQDEYNDYYKQEIRGAETSGIEEEEPSKKGKILAILSLIILAIAGYFGYSSMNNSKTDETLVVKKEIEKPAQTVQTVQTVKEKSKKVEKSVVVAEKEVVKKPVDSIQALTEEKTTTSKDNKVAEVVKNTEKAVGTNGKMSPKEIAKVVQMVMSQMNNKPKEVATNSTEKEESKSAVDTELMSELSKINTDSIDEENEDKKLEDALNNIDDATKDSNIKNDNKTVDTYNKVKVSQNSSNNDELSKLSSQISNLISDKEIDSQGEKPKDEKIYTESLKGEVVTRKNEMRIIVVRKGDTLGKIAKRAYGNVMEYKKIYKANPDILNRPDRIYIGQKLRIPK